METTTRETDKLQWFLDNLKKVEECYTFQVTINRLDPYILGIVIHSLTIPYLKTLWRALSIEKRKTMMFVLPEADRLAVECACKLIPQNELTAKQH
jgi:hypothetical protein